MIRHEPWYKEAEQKLRDPAQDYEDPGQGVTYPKGPKRKRHPGWEDDYEVDIKLPSPESEPETEETSGPDYDALLEELLAPIREEEAKDRERERLQEEYLRAQEEERKKLLEELEKRKRRGRCPFCGGPPHGRGEVGGD